MIEMINNSFYESKTNFFDKERNSQSKRDICKVKKISFSGKCIAKMFSLKKFLISESILKLFCFCETCKESGIFFT